MAASAHSRGLGAALVTAVVLAAVSLASDESFYYEHLQDRGLHSFPFTLNLSLLCAFPLNLSLLCPQHNPTQPVDVARRCLS